MKKTAAILFIIVYLLSTTDTCELFKLPIIFQHYAEHKLEDKNISFLAFLDMHYMHGSPKDKDYDRDMQLPFKKACSDCVSCVIIAAFVPLTMSLSIEKPLIQIVPQNYFPQDQLLVSSYLASIWQPPKLA